MIGRSFIVKNAKSFSKHNEKDFAWKFLTVTEKSSTSKNQNDFTQLWRQWLHVYSKSNSI